MLNKNYPGLFLVFEGIDSTGKSTISKKVTSLLNKAGYTACWTREPGGTEIAEDIRSIILKYDMDIVTEAMLFSAARNHHYQTHILPKLQNGEIVISDRFYGSSYVYQGIVGEITTQVETLHNLIGNPQSDHTFLVTSSFDKIKERIAARNDNNRLDTFALDNIVKMNNGFAQYYKDKEDCSLLVNNDDIDIAIYNCLSKVNTLIKLKGIGL